MTNSTNILERLADLTPPKVSFEFFPAKTEAGDAALFKTIAELERLSPEYVSVTYGAGGSTREKTYQTVKHIRENTSLKPAAHLTCVGATQEEINAVAQSYLDIDVNKIVALRGDPPQGQAKYEPHPGGYPYCVDMIEGLIKLGDFDISVAAFPETHPEAQSPESDIQYLKAKLDAGGKRAITQYFFDHEVYLRFLDNVRAAGITAPIIPGILVISNFETMIRFSKMCGATVPKWVIDLLQGTDETPEKRDMLSALIAAEQCRLLREAGVEQFHFYTLNRAPIVQTVCHLLGIKS